ncbi:MAG: terminase small subunit, partial [Bacteroides sp.]
RSYSCKKMKIETVHRKAVELMANGKVSARVKELQAELKAKSDYKKEDALKSLVDIANANIADFIRIAEDEEIEMQEDGKAISRSSRQVILVRSLDELTPEQQKCIKTLKTTRNGTEIELYSRLEAIDRMVKMCGWDEPTKHEVSGPGIQIEILDAKDKDK